MMSSGTFDPRNRQSDSIATTMNSLVLTGGYLLAQRFDPNELDDRGRTPLDCVLPPGKGPAAVLLVQAGYRVC